MNAHYFNAMLRELVDENPFACRALLKIVSVECTDAVPTLAVTTGDKPRLLVNLAFLAAHCRTDCHVKAVVCHEFLHVLLRHTDRLEPSTAADHLALDAVINAIIHRELGPGYSGMMAGYYAHETGVRRLLRPPTDAEYSTVRRSDTAGPAWRGLYDGRLVADDVRALARDLAPRDQPGGPGAGYLGNHDRGHVGELSPAVEAALGRALKSMNGEGIWRAPKERGVGAHAYAQRVSAADQRVERWRRETWAVLRCHLLPDARGPRTQAESGVCSLPVLSAGDRRAFARALWSPLLSAAVWPAERRTRGGTAQVYLDVSGSMNAEMPLIVALLNRLSRHVRRPFWAFSDAIAPAVIRGGQLLADTTGGTSMNCVLRHLADTRPAAAVVVTDGYVEKPDAALLAATRGTRLHALVTRDGSPAALGRAGIACTQLGRLPS